MRGETELFADGFYGGTQRFWGAFVEQCLKRHRQLRLDHIRARRQHLAEFDVNSAQFQKYVANPRSKAPHIRLVPSSQRAAVANIRNSQIG
jgi:hypothetical protein